MLVRAKQTHFNQAYRVEGEEFEWTGPLHKYIEPVKSKASDEPKGAKAQKSSAAPKATEQDSDEA